MKSGILPLVLLVLVLFCLVPPPAAVFAQGGAGDEKPDAAVAPLGAIGDITEAQQRIIRTSLEALLSRNYRLISESEYLRAEELAFQQLDLEQCTEEQCIRKIQEILQVERLFVLQIIREGDFTQLSLVLVRADDRLVRAVTCDECSIRELNASVERLYRGIVADDMGQAPPLVAVPPPPIVAAPPPVVEEPPADPLSAWRWKWGSTLTFAILATGYSYTESQAVEDSNTRQTELISLMNSATATADYLAYQSELQNEEQAAAKHKTNSDAGAALSAILLGIAAWIYFDPPTDETTSALLLPLPETNGDGLTLTLVTRW